MQASLGKSSVGLELRPSSRCWLQSLPAGFPPPLWGREQGGGEDEGSGAAPKQLSDLPSSCLTTTCRAEPWPGVERSVISGLGANAFQLTKAGEIGFELGGEFLLLDLSGRDVLAVAAELVLHLRDVRQQLWRDFLAVAL